MEKALRLFESRFLPADIPDGSSFAVSSLTGIANAFAALALLSRGGEPSENVILAVVPGIPDADRLADDLRLVVDASQSIFHRTRILELPPRLDGDKTALGMRLKTIAALRAWDISPYPCVVVAPSAALATPLPPLTEPPLVLAAKEKTSSSAPRRFSDICEQLSKNGYSRTISVEQPGEFSVRGGILDVWPAGEEFPVRAEFFGDDLESLRLFDAGTQISVERIDSATVLPLSSGISGLPAESGNANGLISILPDSATILAIGHGEYSAETLAGRKSTHRTVVTGDPAPQGVSVLGFQTAPLPGFAELGAEEAHHPELFDAARQRLDRHLASAAAQGAHILRIDDASSGFELRAESGFCGLAVVAKSDRVFAKKKTSRIRGTSSRTKTGARINDFDELEPGEYVVHVDYGIGRFIGSSEIVVDGKRSEVFTIEYADDAKLHVPAAHAHLLSRYVGVKGESVNLHRMDGKRWSKDKAAAQKAVADLAAALLDTQAKRETIPGFSYDTDCDGLDAFEAAFPYEETPDQAAAIAAIKKDLASTKPMDRLVCGDAGYGKTEVAMRAAYIAALNGRQVAVLAPTTVLAEQHFETFTSRFDGTPVRIEAVSRFQSSGVHDGTFQRLAAGVCDIVIGTHALLSGKVAFRDLGLIIIDEEQRFGVRHKEFLKNLRATADVLTLSATPIPRTLYLSMTGARDLSLLRTPPRERVAVDTKIVTDSDEIVAAAVQSELERGGQVFFLHNRVTTIGKAEKRLKSIVPGARIVVAHGQMDTRTLARKMREFERGDADILLSTTIIESGIDIPRANTILVDRADLFGLADLYQLRGRVGRSSRQGRAVFLLPTGGLVDSDARERLDALKRHGGLGAGFNLAMRDLELRGAGNLLGAQQSGHIAAVGFGLYCQLLQRTVSALKGEKVHDIVDVKLNLDFIDLSPASEDPDAAAALPYGYVEEDALRMSFMKRFGEAADMHAVKAIAAELEDRFGRMPPAARRLIKMAELRVICARAGIGGIDVTGTRAVFHENGTRNITAVTTLKSRSADRKLSELLDVARRTHSASTGTRPSARTPDSPFAAARRSP